MPVEDQPVQDIRLNPDGFHVDEIDRISDLGHSDDGAVVYAITSATGVKGVLVDETVNIIA